MHQRIYTALVMLFFFFLGSVSMAEDGTESQTRGKKSGVGLNIGARIYYPIDINTLISDIWDEMKTGYVVSQMGNEALFLGTPVKLKGVIYVVPKFCIEPYGQFLWSGKVLRVSGAASRDGNVNVIDLSGGCNFWFKFSPQKRVSFKMGAGGYGGYTFLFVSGYTGDLTMKGSGYGGNVLAGIDITFTKVAINIDFIVPIGVSKFTHQEGELSIGDEWEPYKYPSRYTHYGFEIRPGITFHF